MLYHISQFLAFYSPWCSLIKYITFRSFAAMIMSFIITLLIGGQFISYLRRFQDGGQPIRQDGPESHLITKVGTPTMGGVLILLASAISILLLANLNNKFLWVIAFLILAYGTLGFIDDYYKILYKNHNGLSAKSKFITQFCIAIIASTIVYYISDSATSTMLAVPFVKNYVLDLGYFYIVFGALVIVSASNAVNLTDGLDGLAIVPVIIVFACFAIICYLSGNAVFAHYLQIHYVQNISELPVLCCAIIGAGLGFLWFNSAPAQIFMGDVGSLALGAAIGGMSIITKNEILLCIIGGVFVVETLSVMIQVTSFKLRQKRVFKMAPIHHHFEKNGLSETKIVIRVWIISIILAAIGIATLKIR